ncbi:ST3 beta-galactoside alpha-2,3-sialyltransferase 7 isoform X2 [Entelurus aequoreus]|uniref:ST3 beta-galactoside alpha-2,3-sialyltransferase 7 isoform X2 n=1 Tax=Entelurus aequoreus TaxID=161455 RepID=UPI002B1DAF56|nr:ST3 beta-galactoside alpha-2,3-sialyltransferase 7 isoform X2 [Entelurus aequoreus]
MVILNLLSVEEETRGRSPLLPEAAEAAATTHKQEAAQMQSKPFFLSSAAQMFLDSESWGRQNKCQRICEKRSENLSVSVVLLVGCYSAILLPAYFPLQKHSVIDEQDPKHLDLLNRSALQLCRPHWCVDRLKSLPRCSGLMDIPVFVLRDAGWDMPPPLGLRGSKEHLARALAALPQPDLPPSLRRSGERCRRCVVVGSGGVLLGSHLGSHIDQYGVVIRMNNAPVLGYERDAGSHTTIRVTYPEGAPSSADDYNKTDIVALAVFKSLDLDWLTSIITKQPLSLWSKLWFWKEVVDHIPLRPENFRILHPEIIRKTAEVLQRYSVKQGKMVPTLGAGAVVMALQLCDHVSLAGFGYDMQHPHAPLHYYETIPMAAMKAQVVHDVSAEKLFLRELVAAGAVTDLTGAL